MMKHLTIAAILVSSASAVSATTLTFDVAGIADGQTVPQDYGDNVDTSFTDSVGSYGSGGGATPNVTVDYFGGRTQLWTTGFTGLTNVLFEEDPNVTFGLTLTAADGYDVTLESFELSSWQSTTRTIPEIFVDADGSSAFSNSDFALPNDSATTFNDFSATGSSITLGIDGNGLGADLSDIGLDNVVFSQSAVAPIPLPAGGILLLTALGGLGGAGALRRRRRAA